MIYIQLKDLIINTFIARLTKNLDTTFVSYSDLEKYGQKTIRLLNNNGKQAMLLSSKKRDKQFFSTYNDFFTEIIQDNEPGVSFNQNKSLTDLLKKLNGDYIMINSLLLSLDATTIDATDI